MARLRPSGAARLRREERERGFAGRLLSWEQLGLTLQARISRCGYFIYPGRFEVVAWAGERGHGGRRVEIGTFDSVARAQAACELDAQRRLRREEAG